MFRVFSIILLFSIFSCKTDQRSDFLEASDDPDLVPAVDITKMSPALFEGEDLDLPFYVAHFHQLANAVIMEGENTGFIDLSVWRAEKDNNPYNARIMENILSLVYFYTEDKPWNPYFGMTQLRERIEKSLEFWISIQSEDGKFSEYGPEKWNLAATAFGTKFIGDALLRLSNSPSIDQELFEQATGALRKAILTVFNDQEFQKHGKSFSNQYTNVWPGVLSYLSYQNDQELREVFKQRLAETITVFQSPVGYFYEKDGPDWAYNMGTHENNLMMAWHYLQDDPDGAIIIQKSESFGDWLSYNALPEPGQPFFVLNRAVECRQNRPSFRPTGGFLRQGIPLGETIPVNRAFLFSIDEVEQQFATQKVQLEKQWPEVAPLEIDEFFAYSPYIFLHRRVNKWYPSAEEQQNALNALPFNADNQFFHQRKDNRIPAVYSFIRQPSYYLAFNSGDQIQSRQRYGIGIIWEPNAGTILQSQTGSELAAWGTKAKDQALVYEASGLQCIFEVDAQRIDNQDFISNLELSDEVTITYQLGNAGTKHLVLKPDQIIVEIDHPGPFSEYLPLINSSDHFEEKNGALEVHKNDFIITITHNAASVDLQEATSEFENLKVYPFILNAQDRLTYQIKFSQ
jgi:hypothetical protein